MVLFSGWLFNVLSTNLDAVNYSFNMLAMAAQRNHSVWGKPMSQLHLVTGCKQCLKDNKENATTRPERLNYSSEDMWPGPGTP